MDHIYIEENQIVDRYLMRRLSAQETDLFEDHSMSCSACLSQLELAERMQRGLQSVFEGLATGVPAAGVPVAEDSRKVDGPPPVSSGRDRPVPYRRYALIAASLLVVVPLVYLTIEVWRLRQRLSLSAAPEAIINLPSFSLSPVRDSGPGNEPSFMVRVGKNADWLVLALQVDGRDYSPYSVTLLDETGRETWSGAGLMLDGMGEIRLGLAARLFETGIYHLSVNANLPDREPFTVARYSFRLVRQP